MSKQGYKQLAQGTDHELSLETEQEEQPNKREHCSQRTASSTNSTNPANGQSDPCTTSNADPASTTNNDSGTISSFEMDVGEPLAAETRMNRFRRTVFGKMKTVLVGCAAVLLGIIMLSFIVMKFIRHTMTGDSSDDQLISPEPLDSEPVDSALAHLVQSRLSSISFDSPTSPESKALDWMVNVDEFNHTAVSDDRLVQRFAMVAMVYSMNLDRNNAIPNAESVCTWGDGELVVLSCNHDGMLGNFQVVDSALENSHLPVSIGLLTGLTFLTLPGNQLTGSVPTEIGLLTGLRELYLYSNELDGSIPTEIGQLTGLEMLELHRNKLTGSIPASLCGDGYQTFLVDCDTITCSCCKDNERKPCPTD